MSTKSTGDLHLIISNYVRHNYENKFGNHHIPIPLKYVMMKYSNTITGSHLLSPHKDLECIQMFQLKLPNIKQFNLLFRASEHGFSAQKFHSLCDNKGATIVIIKSKNGNVFGGYTSKSWISSDGFAWGRDEKAFLFLIEFGTECPLLFEIKERKENVAVTYHADYGPMFGWNSDITILSKPKCLTWKYSYDYGKFDGHLDGDNRGEIIDYEVFSVE